MRLFPGYLSTLSVRDWMCWTTWPCSGEGGEDLHLRDRKQWRHSRSLSSKLKPIKLIGAGDLGRARASWMNMGGERENAVVAERDKLTFEAEGRRVTLAFRLVVGARGGSYDQAGQKTETRSVVETMSKIKRLMSSD